MLIAQSFDCCTYWLLYIFVSCELVMHTTCSAACTAIVNIAAFFKADYCMCTVWLITVSKYS